MARRLYADCRQFKTVAELEEVVWQVWEEISEAFLEALLRSMQNRCRDCYLAKGGPTKY